MKKYESPVLEDVIILSEDIICASPESNEDNDNDQNIGDILPPG